MTAFASACSRDGSNVAAANRDPSAVDEPEAFRPGRAENQRMLYGHALHQCLAASLGESIMTQAAKALLLRPGFRRSLGAEGRKRLGPKHQFPGGVYPMQLGVQMVVDEA